MDWDSPAFVIVIVAMVMSAAVIIAWINSGMRLKSAKAGRKAQMLEQENAELRDQVGRLEERLEVLERIATDPATRTAREIEHLR